MDYGHVNCSIELDKIKIIQKTNIKFPEAVLHKLKTKRQSTHPMQVLQKLRIYLLFGKVINYDNEQKTKTCTESIWVHVPLAPGGTGQGGVEGEREARLTLEPTGESRGRVTVQ